MSLVEKLLLDTKAMSAMLGYKNVGYNLYTVHSHCCIKAVSAMLGYENVGYNLYILTVVLRQCQPC